MRLRRLFSLLLSLPLSFAIAFSLVCIDVSAAVYSGGDFLTPSDTLSAFGSQIDVTYYNGSDYVDTTATYVNYVSPTWRETLAVLDYPELMQGTLLHYTATLTGINTSNSYVTLKLYPQYSIFDTNKIYTYIAIKSYGVSPSAYQSPSWRWFWNGTQQNIEPFAGYSGTYYPRFENFNGDPYVFIPVRLDSQSITSGYSVSCQFQGGVMQNCDIYIQCPYVSLDAYSSSGTIGSTTINNDVNINVDLDETNSLLDTINNTLTGIVSGIAGIFIPSAADLEQWRLDIVQLLNDTFGDIPALHDQLQDAIENIITVESRSSVRFPGLSPPGVGTIIAAQDVPLKPSGFEALYTFIRTAIDIVATIAVFNMLQNRIKAFLVGETVVYFDNGD